MINIIWQSILYVVNDPFFLASMGFTTAVGIFIGAVIYDGDLKQIKKVIFSLSSYMMLLLVTNLSRTIPEITIATSAHKPIASAVTMIIVTVFYLLGMYMGVGITKRAHKGRVDLKV